MSCNRPLVLIDLDDTLFQTARKMDERSPRHVAALDVNGQPSSYMSDVQKAFVEWLLASADVVPVTARSVEAYLRVALPFKHGAICSHGGVILHTDGTLDADWHAYMAGVLTGAQQRLPALSEATLSTGARMGYSLRGWVASEAGLAMYAATKHNGLEDAVLIEVMQAIKAQGWLEGMSVHSNGNNLAFLPDGLSKKSAVQEWLRRDTAVHGERLVIGLGDSLTDLGFMSECHLWGTPSCSQLARVLEERIDA
jgi:hydroxymethylpyrimidine pyrophosphatase-like HAD family hydrolase